MHSQQMFNECIAKTGGHCAARTEGDEACSRLSLCISLGDFHVEAVRYVDRSREKEAGDRKTWSPSSSPAKPLSSTKTIELVNHRTSQQRTRRRKRITSDCFFFWSSSTYLRAPILAVRAKLNKSAHDHHTNDSSMRGRSRDRDGQVSVQWREDKGRTNRLVSWNFPAVG